MTSVTLEFDKPRLFGGSGVEACLSVSMYLTGRLVNKSRERDNQQILIAVLFLRWEPLSMSYILDEHISMAA